MCAVSDKQLEERGGGGGSPDDIGIRQALVCHLVVGLVICRFVGLLSFCRVFGSLLVAVL